MLLNARRVRRRRLQLSPPARMVEAFVAQNPDCAQPTRPAQIPLKSGSSRPTVEADCVVNQAGSVLREGVVDSEPEAIAAFVRSKAPRTKPQRGVSAEGGSGPPETLFNEFWKPSRGRLWARRCRKVLDDHKAFDLSLQVGV